MSHVTCPRSPVKCNLSSVTNANSHRATATDPPPSIPATMDSRLVNQDRTQSTPPKIKTQKKAKKKVIIFELLAICSSTKILQSIQFWMPTEGTGDKQPDKRTYIYRPRRQCSKNLKGSLDQWACMLC